MPSRSTRRGAQRRRDAGTDGSCWTLLVLDDQDRDRSPRGRLSTAVVVVAVFVMTLVDVGGCVGAKVMVVSMVVRMAPERDVLRGAVEPDGSVVKESHNRVYEVVHGVSEAGSDVADDLLLGLDKR